ncbi:MAG: DUF2141 domain-containing protein [Cyclobacteriaceae bacterium]
MKKITLLLTFLIVLAVSSLQAQHGTIEVTVANIKSENGLILASLFTNEKDFLKTPFQSQKMEAKEGEIVITFERVPVGSYALSVIHDENENFELDSNFFGIPKEGFGFGNDAMGSFGPPSFEKTLVNVGDGKNNYTVVNLKHL